MADLGQLADLISVGVRGPVGPEDNATHTGVVQSWDNLTGVNTVLVNGVILDNLRTLRSGIGVSYTPGDVVVVLRKQTQYFVMGRVTTASSGGSSGVQFTEKLDTQTINDTSSAFVVPNASVTVQCYLPNSSRALMIMTCRFTLYSYTTLYLWPRITMSNGFIMEPDTVPAAGDFNGLYTSTARPAADSLDTSLTVIYLTKPGDGFVPGLTSFQTRVRVDDYLTPAVGVDVHQTSLTIIPL